WGYLAGQIPAGRLADRMGGERVLLTGLALWSLATAATAAAAVAPTTATTSFPVQCSPALLLLLAARVGMGLFSSVIMPAVSAASAQWVPAERKAATLAMIYAFFNMGGVLGLIVAPHLAARGASRSLAAAGAASGTAGWPGAFVTAAAGGLMWALLGNAVLSQAGPRPVRQQQQVVQQQPTVRQSPPGGQGGGEDQANTAAVAATGAPKADEDVARGSSCSGTSSSAQGMQAAAAAATGGDSTNSSNSPSLPSTSSRQQAASGGVDVSGGRRGSGDPRVTGDNVGRKDVTADRNSTLLQVAALCWCHAVIGWGFFVLQAWVPMYLQTLGVADLAQA
ncbi:hypothetical protein Agub_g7826, partial [Astrephomene gubernaculifera]